MFYLFAVCCFVFVCVFVCFAPVVLVWFGFFFVCLGSTPLGSNVKKFMTNDRLFLSPFIPEYIRTVEAGTPCPTNLTTR